jgi:hypothetical protein
MQLREIELRLGWVVLVVVVVVVVGTKLDFRRDLTQSGDHHHSLIWLSLVPITYHCRKRATSNNNNSGNTNKQGPKGRRTHSIQSFSYSWLSRHYELEGSVDITAYAIARVDADERSESRKCIHPVVSLWRVEWLHMMLLQGGAAE